MTHASEMPEERPRRHPEDEAIADEATFTEESRVDEEGSAISEEEEAA